MKMDKIINLDIPHIGEQIFKSINTEKLVEFLTVSKAWKVLAENVLYKRYKGQLFVTCMLKPYQVLKILLERSEMEELNFNFEIDNGVSLLEHACYFGRNEVVKLLLEYSDKIVINLTAKNYSGSNPFMFACSNGRTQIVKAFLEYQGRQQIDVNAKDKNGDTAFMLACKERREDIIKLLMDYSESKSIDLNAINQTTGLTAFMHACSWRGRISTKVVKLLLEYPNNQGINFNGLGNWGQTTPFMFACQSENVELVKLFLDHAESKSIDLNLTRDRSNLTAGMSGQQTAFEMACVTGNVDVVKLLLSHPRKIRSDISAALQLPLVLQNRKLCKYLENLTVSKNLSLKNKKSKKVFSDKMI